MDLPRALISLRVLFVEDSEADMSLSLRRLRAGGYEVIGQRVETADELAAALQSDWDIVLSDFNLPRFRGDKALEMVRALKGPDIPFIVISGTIGDENAVALLKGGASDFVAKTSLIRLVPAVQRELKDAELRRERRQAVEGMQRAIKARDEFLSIASHELRTPVTSLLLRVQKLLQLVQQVEVDERGLSSSVGSKIEMILRLIHRLTDLIDRLLDISSVTSGKLGIRTAKTDLPKLIGDSLDQVMELRGAPKSLVRLQLPGSLVGEWDPDRVETVVVSLLTNAIKYGDGKPVDVVLEDLGEDARLTVTDHGIGIATDDQARIFERFERAVSSRHFGGFGLGLWLSRQIIEAHGGSIQVQSEPGKGSTFEVKLPRIPRVTNGATPHL